MSDQVRNPGEKRLHYNINKWGEKGQFEILHEISKNFTLVQLMYIVGNVNHAVVIVGCWIFDFNNKQKSASFETRFVESPMLPFGRRRNVFRV